MNKTIDKLDFETAFKYPFNRAKGMLNIFWIFLPIFGWLALGGYGVRIVQEFVKGNFLELPVLKFNNDFKLGFFMLVKAVPFIIAYAILSTILTLFSPVLVIVRLFIEIFIIPILFINFMKKETVESLFEFSLVNVVFSNFKDYVVVFLKSILLAIIFFVMMIILVGIPASVFTKNMFIADFYRRNVK
ncbi:hypothetical protein CL617_03005 [archaeon]|nr:hypothetical protein [archaeon]|tara:strand:- start:12403 stop:12966 length:564 start_codon:yes stop_codon:yes gene_type:complete